MKSFTSLYSNKSITSLRHPMLMNEYDADFAVIDDPFDGFPSIFKNMKTNHIHQQHKRLEVADYLKIIMSTKMIIQHR